MFLGKTSQGSAETKRYIVSYSCKLDTNEKIVSATAETDNVTDPVLVIDDPILGASKKTATLYISGGAVNSNHNVTVTVTTNYGQVLVDFFTLRIRDT